MPPNARRRWICWLAGWSIAVGTGRIARAADESVPRAGAREFFETRIRPVLAAHCYSCHGATKQQGGLRVDSRDALRNGGDSGPAVEAGQPDDSLIVRVIEHSDPGMEMPKNAARLPSAVARDFRQWVQTGAFDPRDKAPSAEESSQLEWQAKLAERRGWWSLQRLSHPAQPHPRNGRWAASFVDPFILARLEAAGLAPAPPADRPALARRLAFVLTGLPPNADVLRTFLGDPAPDAYERLVERLLASPRFGERWARHWMDVVRYGDTYGYEWDIPAKGAWRYRDYLVRAYNGDVPFDQLIREQIAGDLLPGPRINTTDQINESLIGPMLYQLGEKRHGDSAMFEGIHQEMLHNKIDAFSKAFQGLTVGCARCHDHKLDAISQRDYYAIAGLFMSPRWVTRTLDMPERNAVVLDELRSLKRPLRLALADRWLEQSARWPDELLAARTKTAPAEAWGKAIAAAGAEPPWENVFRPWQLVAKAEPNADAFAAAWTRIASAYAEEAKRRSAHNARAFRLVADFRRGAPDGWSVEGAGFRDGPVRSGDFTVALEGERAIGSLLPSGLFTHALSPRLNGAVRTPYLEAVPEPSFLIEDCGGDFSCERVVVDNAFLAERQVYLARRDPGWSTFSALHDLPGRHNYVELATKSSNPNFPPRVGLGGPCSEAQVAQPQSWLGVTRVMAAKEPGVPLDELTRFRPLFDGPAPRTQAEAAQRYVRWWREAIERWKRDAATDDDVRLINGLLDLGVLPNRSDATAPARVRELVAAYRQAERKVLEPATVNGMADLDAGYDYRLNLRGQYDQLGPAVPRGYLVALSRDDSASLIHAARSGRLELADRIASAENPLTARVYVNRVWHWVFGTGLVATPDDFGRLGEAPSHPELLDTLAGWFIDHGWSTKELVRALVTSSTFRQAGAASPEAREADPRNRLLHHYPLRRLEAEAVRDAVLAASGRLDGRLYGAPTNPHRPKEDPDKRLFSGPIDGLGRRSIYTKLTIMEPPRFLATFNQPPPKIPTGRRDVTSVPAQALALLNDPFVLEQARFWGTRLAATPGPGQSVDSRLAGMFLTALGRTPEPAELDRWRGLVEGLARERGVSPTERLTSAALWADVAHTFFNTKEFLYLR
jgi:hypothetical protein